MRRFKSYKIFTLNVKDEESNNFQFINTPKNSILVKTFISLNLNLFFFMKHKI